jgi:hypothetical protein
LRDLLTEEELDRLDPRDGRPVPNYRWLVRLLEAEKPGWMTRQMEAGRAYAVLAELRMID